MTGAKLLDLHLYAKFWVAKKVSLMEFLGAGIDSPSARLILRGQKMIDFFPNINSTIYECALM
jgi:hypothetical protein